MVKRKVGGRHIGVARLSIARPVGATISPLAKNLQAPPQQRAADADNRPSQLREVTCRVHPSPRFQLRLQPHLHLEQTVTRTSGGA